ncbi:MAG: hypothetical protein RR144_05180 [Clostridia bacterium]
MKKRGYVFVCILFIISIFSTGCSIKIASNKHELESEKIIMKANGNHKYKSIDFKLGQKYIKIKNMKDSPYYIRGSMSVPTDMKNEKLKPVLIIHGCHDNNNEKRYDTGFKYLTDFLAQNGYLGISIDVNSAYDWKYGDNLEYIKIPIIVDEHIKTLQKADKGEGNFGVDLKNRIDFKNISMMGHSTGGEVVFNIVEKQRKKNININTLLAVAPTNNIETNFNVNIDNTSILVSGLDGDVSDLCGLSIYNQIRKKDNINILAATVLENANHNYFNSEVKSNDAKNLGVNLSKQIKREQQEKFLQEFVVNYLDTVYKGKMKNTIYDGELTNIKEINKESVYTYLSSSKKNEIIDIKNIEDFKSNTTDIKLVKDSSNINKDIAIGIDLPGSNDFSTNLLNVKWKNKRAKLSFKPNIKDFSNYDNVSINVMIDGMDSLNEKNKPQGMSIEFIDSKNQSDIVEINKESKILLYPKGKEERLELEGEKPIVYWGEITPMTNIRIPLRTLENIDLTCVNKINILFNKSDSGGVMFESFSLN